MVKRFFNFLKDLIGSSSGDRRESLELNERRLRAVLETLPVGVLMSDHSGKMIHVNREALRLWGEPGQNSISDYQKKYKVWDHHTGRLLGPHEWAMTRALQGERVINEIIEIELPSGERKILARFASPIYGPDGENFGGVTVTQDITQEMKIEKERESLLHELESKSNLLQTVLDQLPAAVVVAEGPSGRLMLYSERAPDVFHQEMTQGEALMSFVKAHGYHPDGRPYDPSEWPLVRALEKGEFIKNEDIEVLRVDGTRATMRLSAAPVRNSAGDIFAGVVIAEDVSDYRKALQDLKEAKEASESANRLKSSFLANMSHEIRTPLGAILGFVELMKDSQATTEDKAHYLDIINRNCMQLKNIVSDILDFSKIEANYLMIEHIECSLSRLLEEVKNSLSIHTQKKGLHFEINIDSSVPDFVETDPTRLKQILMNVIGNAIKFTHQGFVKVQVSLGEATRKLQPYERFLSIKIEDTGIGMSPEQAQKLFTVFTQADESMTRKYGGTGLGLALSRRIAKLLGGDIALKRSEVGGGSLFEITFFVTTANGVNALRADEEAEQSSPVTPLKPLQGLRVLLVEDVPDNQALIERMIQKKGGSVIIASDGEQGVQRGLELDPDIILMDIQMPVLDGYSATKKLRERGYKKPIIALTAHTLPDVRRECLAAGCTDYIAKPMRLEEMVRKIKQALSFSV